MNLHRALQHEWSSVPNKNRNVWQRIAARTDGVVTPGNLVSLIGVCLTVYGSVLAAVDKNWLGIGLIVLGRLLDVVDGYLADKTGTKSPVGEAVDAASDKFGALIVIIAFSVAGLLPGLIIAAVVLHNVASTVLFGLATIRRGRIHPTTAGKISTALEWVGVIAWATAVTISPDASQVASTMQLLAATTIGVSIMLAVISTIEYTRQYNILRRTA